MALTMQQPEGESITMKEREMPYTHNHSNHAQDTAAYQSLGVAYLAL